MKTLVAGFGNIFLSDDGFGPAVLRALDASALPAGVRVRDFGTGGMHLALEMCADYDLVIIVDAIFRPDVPGTLFVVEAEASVPKGVPDAHAMDVGGVLATYDAMASRLSAKRPKVLVLGCVPEKLEEGMELSPVVESAIPRCKELLHKLTRTFVPTEAVT